MGRRLCVGMAGTVRTIGPQNIYGVEMPGVIGGNNLGGLLTGNYGWDCGYAMLELR